MGLENSWLLSDRVDKHLIADRERERDRKRERENNLFVMPLIVAPHWDPQRELSLTLQVYNYSLYLRDECQWWMVALGSHLTQDQAMEMQRPKMTTTNAILTWKSCECDFQSSPTMIKDGALKSNYHHAVVWTGCLGSKSMDTPGLPLSHAGWRLKYYGTEKYYCLI